MCKPLCLYCQLPSPSMPACLPILTRAWLGAQQQHFQLTGIYFPCSLWPLQLGRHLRPQHRCHPLRGLQVRSLLCCGKVTEWLFIWEDYYCVRRTAAAGSHAGIVGGHRTANTASGSLLSRSKTITCLCPQARILCRRNWPPGLQVLRATEAGFGAVTCTLCAAGEFAGEFRLLLLLRLLLHATCMP